MIGKFNAGCKAVWWDGQYEFMLAHGLKPNHTLLDLGCGPLGGGMRLIQYLDAGKYYGMDCSAYLAWNLHVLQRADKMYFDKQPRVIQSSEFDVAAFGVSFDYAMAFSLLTHLDLNQIIVLLEKLRGRLAGPFYATIFCIEETENLLCQKQRFCGMTQFLKDSYHYRWSQIQWAAGQAGMDATFLGKWIDDTNVQQQMVEFRVAR